MGRVISPAALGRLHLIVEVLSGRALELILRAGAERRKLRVSDIIFDVAAIIANGQRVWGRWRHATRTHSLYMAEQISPIVTPVSFLMIVHQGEKREIKMIWVTRGSVAGSSFPCTVLSP